MDHCTRCGAELADSEQARGLCARCADAARLPGVGLLLLAVGGLLLLLAFRSWLAQYQGYALAFDFAGINILLGGAAGAAAVLAGVLMLRRSPAAPAAGILASLLALVYLAFASLVVFALLCLMIIQGMEGSYGPYSAADTRKAVVIGVILYTLVLAFWYAVVGRFIPLFVRCRRTRACAAPGRAPAAKMRLAVLAIVAVCALLAGFTWYSVARHNTRERLSHAALSGDLSVIRDVMERTPAFLREQTWVDDALVTVVYTGRADVVRYLLDEQKVDVNARDATGKTALHAAGMTVNVLMAQLLLDRGAGVNLRDDEGDTPLACAVTGSETAAISDRVRLVALLLEHGADPNIANAQGFTPIELTWHAPVAEYLLAHGARREEFVARSRDHGAFMGTVEEGNIGMARLMLRYGADVNGEAWYHRPLHEAAYRKDLPMARLLLDQGADVRTRNRKGETPLAIAKRQGDAAMQRLLRSYGATE